MPLIPETNKMRKIKLHSTELKYVILFIRKLYDSSIKKIKDIKISIK